MIKRKNILKIAIDSPAAAGAGTLGQKISKHYKLFYLDTGKIYRFIAYLIPLTAMLLSDLYLGFHAGMPIVYFSLAVCVLIGTFIESRVSIINSLLSISLGVLVFFLITNFTVWYGSGMYEHSISGLMNCYFMGLPFVQNTFISSLLYGMGAFLVFDIINKRIIYANKA